MSTKEEVAAQIIQKGEQIRELKASKATKADLDPVIAQLLALKESFKALNGGIPYDPPKVEPVKKEKVAEPVAVVSQREGPSKKELNKMARKEKRSGHPGKDEDEEDGNSAAADIKKESTSTVAAAVVNTPPANTDAAAASSSSASSTSKSAPVSSSSSSSEGGVHFHSKSASPDLSRIVSALLTNPLPFFSSASSSTINELPYLSPPTVHFKSQHAGASSISGDANIARYLCRSAPSTANTTHDLYQTKNPWLASEIDQWLDVYASYSNAEASKIQGKLLAVLEKHYSDKTHTVGNSLTLADIAVFVLLKRTAFTPSASSPSVSRFYTLLQTTLPPPAAISTAGQPPVYTKNNKNNTATTSKSTSTTAAGTDSAADTAAGEEGGTCPPLEDAVEGEVCTRFPPEPSGYLHIGHAKAVLLNQYYAQRYKGKLLVRFDDTNPSKEKEEYAENILQDLQTLGVKPHKVSHTSDHFAACEELARKMIREGKGYMDDTDQETMQAERMKLIESTRRNTTVEENMKVFEDLLKGETYAQKYCLRAKIDMSSVNGTMRDPVLYRFNDTPHHRTGTKYKAYPTYDFACPVVDSVEGVTHALRTTEYNDRDEQYHWLQHELGLRTVKIQSFGKMNFIHTVLSKRKLNWFVEQGLVEGWFDPRFPTIQGCVRRGMNVEALKSFILSQGASRRVITMEWDKFWSENKKVLEDVAPRYMGVSVENMVEFFITNVSDDIVAVSVQIHPQKPEMGNRVMRKTNKLLIDQADAQTFKEGEEVTFLRWGNFFIDKIIKSTNDDKIITRLEGRFHPEATNFSKTKKTTWLAAVEDTVSCELIEFDHLISKAKLNDDEDFKDYVNPVTRKMSMALCDPCLRLVKAGDVIQLERKGFYRVDQAYSSNSSSSSSNNSNGKQASSVVLFAIPDGRVVKNKEVAPAATAPVKKKK